ncbi:protein DEHYDRATION-INDUCED 19 isoform X1 [Capsicum chacoense]
MDDRDNDLKILLSALKDGGMYVGEDEDEDEEEEEEEEFEDEDIKDDNVKTDLACPFCSEDFDMLGLCCHIDSEHRIEAKTGICPLCSTKVRTNMATHVIVQHESVLKISFTSYIPIYQFHMVTDSLRSYYFFIADCKRKANLATAISNHLHILLVAVYLELALVLYS